MNTPIARRTDGMGDEALTAATGKPWAEWYAILDAVDATAWTHQQIAAYLKTEHGVPDWWCQGVTIGFEQERGMRLPGQRADGSFEVNASATFALGQQEALDAVIAAVSAGRGTEPTRVSRDVTFPTARWTDGGPGVIMAMANATKAGKTSVSLTAQRLSDPADVAPAKLVLKGWLDDARRASSGAEGLS